MKPIFEILPEPIFYEQTDLICEISPTGISWLFVNDSKKRVHGLSVFNFGSEDLTGSLKQIFSKEKLLNKNYKKVFISYSFEESALVPEVIFNVSHDQLMDTLFGDLNEGIILSDLLAEKNIYNIYRIPEPVHHLVADRFPVATFNHQYTSLVKQFSENKSVLSIIFYPGRFVVILINNGLQIVQTFCYENPKDVVYHLLNITKQFEIKDVPVRLEGIIENRSGLFNAINTYFSHVTFAEISSEIETAEKIKEFPAHYFSHLFSLASCV